MELTGKQRKYLRGLAHHLDPVVIIGGAGISEALVAKVDAELDNHELIKVKVGRGASMKAGEAAPELARATDAHVAGVIGRVVMLYRRRAEEPEIVLPQGRASD